jgi:hypothetical protein
MPPRRQTQRARAPAYGRRMIDARVAHGLQICAGSYGRIWYAVSAKCG